MGRPWFTKMPRGGAVSAFICILYLCSTFTTVGSVKCYVCVDAASNDDCNQEEHLIDCKTRSTAATELDTCQTKVFYDETRGYRLTKRCVRGPCNLGDDQTAVLNLQCDRSTSSWGCESCCATDGCNKDDAMAQQPHVIVITLLSLTAMVYLLIY